MPFRFEFIMYYVTVLLLLWVVASFTVMRYYQIDSSVVAISYKKVVEQREYWRVFFAWISHDEISQFVFNAFAIWAHRHLEIYYGSWVYAKFTFMLLIISSAIYLLIIHKLTQSRGPSSFLLGLQNLESLGYTGIVLGWTVMQVELPHFSVDPIFYLFDILPLPAPAAPSILLLFVQLLMWNSSVLNHVSGLFAGYLVAIGAFNWLTEYYFICALQWVAVACILSKGFPPRVDTEQVAEQRRAEEFFNRMV